MKTSVTLESDSLSCVVDTSCKCLFSLLSTWHIQPKNTTDELITFARDKRLPSRTYHYLPESTPTKYSQARLAGYTSRRPYEGQIIFNATVDGKNYPTNTNGRSTLETMYSELLYTCTINAP